MEITGIVKPRSVLTIIRMANLLKSQGYPREEIGWIVKNKSCVIGATLECVGATYGELNISVFDVHDYLKDKITLVMDCIQYSSGVSSYSTGIIWS